MDEGLVCVVGVLFVLVKVEKLSSVVIVSIIIVKVWYRCMSRKVLNVCGV